MQKQCLACIYIIMCPTYPVGRFVHFVERTARLVILVYDKDKG